MGDFHVEFDPRARALSLPEAVEKGAPPDEYLAGRDSETRQSREVVAMNKEMDAWTQVNAPDVFKEKLG